MSRTHKRSGIAVAALTVALAALGGAAAHAQDQRPDDQSRHEDQGHRDDQGRDHDQGRHDNNDHARHDEGGGDSDRYRKQHPHAAARCHDGFFTNTGDRGRACSKHGGIDVWLRE